jgi:hypothetical protein
MKALETYIKALVELRGRGVKEETFYTPFVNLLNDVGAQLKPKVKAGQQTAKTEAGKADVFLYDETQPSDQDPSHGVVEAKPTSDSLDKLTTSEQVAKYIRRYGLVIATNLYQFALVVRDDKGNPKTEEIFKLAENEAAFWKAAEHPRVLAEALGTDLNEYLLRVMQRRATLTDPKQVARILASYARLAKQSIERNDKTLTEFANIRSDFEAALGITYSGDEGNQFFVSTMVQTMFYGVFSAWILWHESNPRLGDEFNLWRDTRRLPVPVLDELFYQLTNADKLDKLGIEDLMLWTVDALNRVERTTFFANFNTRETVQYFYEPFLEAFDPELRKQLGVWYTPTEIVDYMVARVDRVLETELGIKDGLADPNVYVLDPCCGTGAYLVAVLNCIYQRVYGYTGQTAEAAQAAHRAILERICGFEILTAPFVVAHLQMNLLLSQWGAPLKKGFGAERAGMYLTNALTGWKAADGTPKQLFLERLEHERDAADGVKQGRKILVVIGNPPYNAFAGTSPQEEEGLVEPYKVGLNSEWGIRKFNLDDLYVRFFRLAERCIAELNEDSRGVVCYISNFSYLSDPSFVVARQRFLREFDKLWFDGLNGDSRETGKRIPRGLPGEGSADPSVFSTEFNREGIRVGTAVALMVRKPQRQAQPTLRYRDFWGSSKREDILNSLNAPDFDAQYHTVTPAVDSRYSFRPYSVSDLYMTWPKLTDLCAVPPMNGLMEKRGGALIDIDRVALEQRMRAYFDPKLDWYDYHQLGYGLTEPQSRFDPRAARKRAVVEDKFDPQRLIRYALRPFDTRWCYYTPIRPIWNEPRPNLWAQQWEGNRFLMSRPSAATADEAIPFCYTRLLGDNDFLRGHAYYFPLFLKNGKRLEPEGQASLFDILGESPEEDKPVANLSQSARAYLAELGFSDPDDNPNTAALIWMHALAVGFAPSYLAEHEDGIQADWPRIPMPEDKEALIASASLGEQVAALLDTEADVRGITSSSLVPEVRGVAVLTSTQRTLDYQVNAGWGHLSQGAVMPGRGRIAEADGGYDIYLNDTTYWHNIPMRVWNYTIGGYQVLKKWLSYREFGILGRALTSDEAREFTQIARRLAALVALEAQLDENYRIVSGQ